MPKPRDLTELSWTVDTLTDGQAPVELSSIDGQSAEALFAVGTSADSQAVVFAYDGQGWRETFRVDAPSALHGICTAGPVDLWAVGAVGDSGLVLQHTGDSWQSIPHPHSGPLLTVDAGSNFDVWCGGEQGIVLHHTLFQWERYSLGNDLAIESIAEVTPVNVYAIARRTGPLSPFDYPDYLCYFNGVRWQRIDSIPPPGIGLPQRFGTRLYSELSRLYSLGPGLFFLDIDHWQRQITADDLRALYLENTNNIVAVGKEIFHFNGVQWYSFTPFTEGSVTWSDVWMDASEVFVAGTDGRRTLLLHGR
ncbi:MAG: hypothetical protein WB699_19715 [Bacteroidota bacterium]